MQNMISFDFGVKCEHKVVHFKKFLVLSNEGTQRIKQLKLAHIFTKKVIYYIYYESKTYPSITS